MKHAIIILLGLTINGPVWGASRKVAAAEGAIGFKDANDNELLRLISAFVAASRHALWGQAEATLQAYARRPKDPQRPKEPPVPDPIRLPADSLKRI